MSIVKGVLTILWGWKSALVQEYFSHRKRVWPRHQDTALKVRLVRINLPSGETEVLITSLLNPKRYPNGIFKELYFKRWKVETFYDELKNKLKVEHFSGYSSQSIQQDFNAAIFISNVQTLIVGNLEEELWKSTKNRKIITLLFSNTDITSVIEQLKILFKQNLMPIRPNRSNKRNIGKYRRRERPKITKNQKDAIWKILNLMTLEAR